MKLRITGALALTALALTAPSAAKAEAGGGPTCHGKPATYVGTAGDDRVDDDAKLGRNPVLVLGGGDDRLRLGYGDSNIRDLVICAGAGNDYITVYESVSASSYLLDGGSGSDWVGNADDTDFSSLEPMTIIGGSGDDHLRGANDVDRLIGGTGDDRAFGLGRADRIVGGDGDDALFGLGSGDTLLGGAGEDILEGDSEYFTRGEDVADGGADSDRCEAEIKRNCER